MTVPKTKKLKRLEKVCGDFPFWMRTGRKEAEKFPNRLRVESNLVKNSKKRDFKDSWVIDETPLRSVEKGLGIGLRDNVKMRVKRKGKVHVLDLGCGHGRALAELKEIFGEKIFTAGITLKRNPNSLYKGVEKVFEGEFHSTRIAGKYDLIYDYFGVVSKTQLKRDAFEKIIGLLKPGGIAAIDIGVDFERAKNTKTGKEVMTVLKQSGVNYKLTREFVLIIHKPERKIDK